MKLKYIKKKYLIIISILITLITLVGIQIFMILNKEEEVIVEQKIVIIEPNQIVKEFYNWYMRYQGSPFQSKAYLTMPQLSQELIDDIQKRIDDNRLNYDPFVCKSTKPLGVGIISQEIIQNNAKVTINTDYGQSEQVDLNLRKKGDSWEIISVNCPQIEQYKKIDQDTEKNRVSIFLIDSSKGTTEECNLNLIEVKKIPENTADTLGSALKELFKGTSIEDQENNLESAFIKNGQEILRSVKIDSDTITLTILNKDQYFANLSTCQTQQLQKQLEETIRYYKYEQDIVIE